jgi:hypothetical protein
MGSRIRAHRRWGWKGVAGFRRGGGGPPWWLARTRAAATFRCSAGDGERRVRCGPPSWSLRRRRRAPAASSSGGTAGWSLAPMVAAALCGGRRGAQATKAAGGQGSGDGFIGARRGSSCRERHGRRRRGGAGLRRSPGRARGGGSTARMGLDGLGERAWVGPVVGWA